MQFPLKLPFVLTANANCQVARNLFWDSIRMAKLRSYFLVVLFFFLANLPSLLLVYGLTDDYFFLLHYSEGDTAGLKSMFYGIGRPLTHLFLKMVFSNLNFISDLRYVRLIGFIGIVFYGAFVFFLLEKKRVDEIEKIFLITGLLFIPPINLYISWSQYFVAGFALLLSSLSAFVLFSDNKISVKNIIISAILLIISGLTHQSLAMQFWPISFLILFYKDPAINRQKIKRLLVSIITGAISMVVIYAFIKFYQIYSGVDIPRTNLIRDYFGKILWFVSESLPGSLSFYSFTIKPYFSSYSMPLLLLVICTIGLFLHFQKNDRFLGFVVTIIFVVLSYFPNLIVSENWASFRTQVALTSMFMIVLAISLRNIFQGLKRDSKFLMFVISLLFVFFYARTQLLYISYPQSIEVSFVKYRIADIFRKNIFLDNLVVIRSSWQDSLESSRYDEFGIPSTYPTWAVEPMIRLILREFENNPVIYNITVIQETEMTEFQKQVILDLREISLLRMQK